MDHGIIGDPEDLTCKTRLDERFAAGQRYASIGSPVLTIPLDLPEKLCGPDEISPGI
jgi:hypothetical protein